MLDLSEITMFVANASVLSISRPWNAFCINLLVLHHVENMRSYSLLVNLRTVWWLISRLKAAVRLVSEAGEHHQVWISFSLRKTQSTNEYGTALTSYQRGTNAPTVSQQQTSDSSLITWEEARIAEQLMCEGADRRYSVKSSSCSDRRTPLISSSWCQHRVGRKSFWDAAHQTRQTRHTAEPGALW